MSTSSSHSRIRGVSVVELLVALAILGVVLTLAYSGIIGSLTTQVQQESTVAAQGKMRRIVEVLSQELRSAVFGSLIDAPYSSSSSSVSFLLLAGGAGYPVGRYSSSGVSQIDVVAPSTGLAVGNQVLIADQHGRGVLTRITNIGAVQSNGMRRFTFSCGMPMPYTANTLMFDVTSLGIRYDADLSEIFLRTSLNGIEQPFAFDISAFRLDYIYVAPGMDPIVRPAPERTGGIPSQSIDVGGVSYRLARLQVVLSVEAVNRDDIVTHTLSSQIELLSNQDFALRELTTCA